ncbi:MAG TPA: hypothetical protein VJA22_02575 [Patescibacteria group bacterium]|nr:hypothetical protein [Patescibacteria group bacterium]
MQRKKYRLQEDLRSAELDIQNRLDRLPIEDAIKMTDPLVTPEIFAVPENEFGLRLAILRAPKMPEFGFLMFRDRLGEMNARDLATLRQLHRIFFLPTGYDECVQLLQENDLGYTLVDPKVTEMFYDPMYGPLTGTPWYKRQITILSDIYHAVVNASPLQFLFLHNATAMFQIAAFSQTHEMPGVQFCEVSDFRVLMLRKYGSEVISSSLSFIDWERSNVQNNSEGKGSEGLGDSVGFHQLRGCRR